MYNEMINGYDCKIEIDTNPLYLYQNLLIYRRNGTVKPLV